MADIRVERKSGGRGWMWILLLLVLLIVAALLLEAAGYIDIPGIDLGGGDTVQGPARSALPTDAYLQEA